MNIDFVKELNEIQQKAVTHVKGPLMVLAGPGSGKTRVLTYRIAYMIASNIDAFHILALTFTNKAADEMKKRIEKLVGTEGRNVWAGTFHSIFARILRVEAEKIGFPNNFTIYDTADSKSVIKTIIQEQGLSDTIYKPSAVLSRISAAKNGLIGPAKYNATSELIEEDRLSGKPKIGLIYAEYTKRCKRAGAMDFDDLLMKMYELLSRFPEVLLKYQHRFKYIMVDEFQDTNTVQFEIVKKLAALHENLCVVGDDAQSIYGFRGATIENILNFEKNYQDFVKYKLEQNYRSIPSIVDAANEVIAFNKNQLEKKIWTEKNFSEKIKVYKAASDNEEGKIIAENIFIRKNQLHYKNTDFAILYRTNAQSRAFEEALRNLGISYKVFGGMSFYQRKEIKDMMAYLRLIVNHIDEEALRRVINYPKKGIGETTVHKISIWADENNTTLWQICENIQAFELPSRQKELISEFVLLIKSLALMLQDKDAFEVAQEVAKQSKILSELYADKTIEGIARYENLQELMNGIKEFASNDELINNVNDVNNEEFSLLTSNDKSLSAYLQSISLVTDLDDKKAAEKDNVSMMTIHTAKGLEFKNVYVVGMEENLFPSFMSMNAREELEEERRLFYVAITRAEDFLGLSFATTRFKYGKLQYCQPSRFLSEISSNNLDNSVLKQNDNIPKKNPLQDNAKLNSLFKKPNTNAPQKTFEGNFNILDPKLLSAGLRILHQRFGYGNIVQIDNTGIASIKFDDNGEKRIMLKFAMMEIV
jgi:DNA helicase-2/ATP-dependent DNA helicase PcrA